MKMQAESMAGAGLAGVGLFPLGVAMAMATSVQSLRDRVEELTQASATIVDAAGDRDLTDDEIATIEANAAEVDKISRQITAREAATPPPAVGQGRRTVPETAAAGADGGQRRTIPATPKNSDPRGGFRSFGEFALATRSAAMRDENATSKLLAVSMNEGVGEDGGFLVPPEFREGIMKVVEGEESLLPLTDNSTTSKNAVAHAKDETTPWGTSGIRVYWEGEAQSVTVANAKFQSDTLRLNKLFARVDVTDELLEDAPQLDNYLRVKAPEVMTSVLNLAIVQGNGVGKPLGIMRSPALVTVSKETSQPADTIHHRNLVKMMGRMYPQSWPRSVWLLHQDVWAQLPLLSFRDVGGYPSTASGTAFPVYMPPTTGIAGAPLGTLFGRPIKVLQAMETIGDLGDIVLADLTKYRTLMKAGGARVDTSIHLKFDTDEQVFRFIFRVAGAPWWSAPITPRDGSNTLSPFVTLESR